jgi:prepilin-type N-terminal cleavage/methylation domain-containing protein
MHPANRSQFAFSLVELSIVLVILGLLVGGVLAGQSLIRAAELRAVTTEYNKFYTASRAFRDKYFAVPGDMSNATKFWGASAACPATAGTGTQTCDGDGNGSIGLSGGTSQYSESFTYWQHLANAGLIEGTYTGMSGAGGSYESNTTNSPKSKLASAIWFVSTDTFSAPAFFPVALARSNFRIGALAGTNWPFGKLLKPEEAWNIDTKLDDGLPGTGKVTAPTNGYANEPNCASTAVASTAVYSVNLSSLECILIMDAGL